MLKTETPSTLHVELDLYRTDKLVAALIDDQLQAVEAVRLAAPQITAAITAECGIVLDTGMEVISGSTRLKAGTAQKITLNTISSALMVGLHKTYGNLMVDLTPTNAKLILRAVRLTMHATGAGEAQARSVLEQCQFHVKVAIVALLKKMTTDQAQALLAGAGGSVRLALAA